MKSVFMESAALIAFFIQMAVCYLIAFLIVRGVLKQFRKNGSRAPFVLLPLGAFIALLPTWGSFPGRILAERLCDSLSARYADVELPLVAERLSLPPSHDKYLVDFVRFLTEYGFAEVADHSPKGSLQEDWRKAFPEKIVLSLRPKGAPECSKLSAWLDQNYELKRGVYQAGLKPSQCIAVSEGGSAKTEVRIARSDERRFFPVSTTIYAKSLFRDGGSRPVFEKFAFYYFESNPRRGHAEQFVCGEWPNYHRQAPTKMWEWDGKIIAADAPRNPLRVDAVAEKDALHRVELEYREEWLELRQDDQRFIRALGYSAGNPDDTAWVLLPRNTDSLGRHLLQVTDNDREAEIVLPGASAPFDLGCHAVHGVRRDSEKVLVVRSASSGHQCDRRQYLEVLTYDVSSRQLDRRTVDLNKVGSLAGTLGHSTLDDIVLEDSSRSDGKLSVSLLLFNRRSMQDTRPDRPTDALALTLSLNDDPSIELTGTPPGLQ